MFKRPVAATVQLDPATFALTAHIRCDICQRFQWDSRATCSPSLSPGETEMMALRMLRRSAEFEGWVWPTHPMGAIVCPPCRGEREDFDSQPFLTLLDQGHLDVAYARLLVPLQNCIYALVANRPSAGAADALSFGRALEVLLTDQGSVLVENLQPFLEQLENLVEPDTPFTSVPLRGFQTDGVLPGDLVTVAGSNHDGEYVVAGVDPAVAKPIQPWPPGMLTLPDILDVLQGNTRAHLHEARPAYLHPEALAVLRKDGRDMLEVNTNAELLRRGLHYYLRGFPLYSMQAIPKHQIYLPVPTWVPRRDPDTGLFYAIQDIQDRYLFPKLPRTRWERMLGDDEV